MDRGHGRGQSQRGREVGSPLGRVPRGGLDCAAATDRESEASHFAAAPPRANGEAGDTGHQRRTRFNGRYLGDPSGPGRVARRPRSNGTGTTMLRRLEARRRWTRWYDRESKGQSEGRGRSPRVTYAQHDMSATRSLAATAAYMRQEWNHRDTV